MKLFVRPASNLDLRRSLPGPRPSAADEEAGVASVLENRRRALQCLLDALVEHPDVGCSSVLEEFLGLREVKHHHLELPELRAELLNLEAAVRVLPFRDRPLPDRSFDAAWERLERAGAALAALEAARRRTARDAAEGARAAEDVSTEVRRGGRGGRGATRAATRALPALLRLAPLQAAGDSGALQDFCAVYSRAAASAKARPGPARPPPPPPPAPSGCRAPKCTGGCWSCASCAQSPPTRPRPAARCAAPPPLLRGARGAQMHEAHQLLEKERHHALAVAHDEEAEQMHVVHAFRRRLAATEEKAKELEARALQAEGQYRDYCRRLRGELGRLERAQARDLVAALRTFASVQREFHRRSAQLWGGLQLPVPAD
eukprot:tig00000808_g4420.t1